MGSFFRDVLTIGAVLLSSFASGQNSSITPANSKLYVDPELRIAFAYPSDLEPEPSDVTGRYSYRTRFAMHPKDDPEHKGEDPCSPLVVAIGMGADRPKDPSHPGKPGHQVPLLPTGGISLNEIKHACIAKDSPGKSDEDVLGDYVDNIRYIDGLPPIAKTIAYEVQGRTVFLAVAGGFSKNEKRKACGFGWIHIRGQHRYLGKQSPVAVEYHYE